MQKGSIENNFEQDQVIEMVWAPLNGDDLNNLRNGLLQPGLNPFLKRKSRAWTPRTSSMHLQINLPLNIPIKHNIASVHGDGGANLITQYLFDLANDGRFVRVF